MASPGQSGFFDNNQPRSVEIAIKDNHELVTLSDSVDWLEQIQAAHHIRASKVEVLCGPEPRYRELLGAITLMAVRNITLPPSVNRPPMIAAPNAERSESEL